MEYFAGIDIGTNTLLLLIMSKDEFGHVTILHDEHRIARLGEGINQTGSIAQSAIHRAQLILKEYTDILSLYPGIQVKAIATSAMRDANNSQIVKVELEQVLGYPIDIISGIEEARLTFLGSREEYHNPVIIDIGGGSTEIIHIHENQESCKSLDIGAVRLTDKFINQLPISEQSLNEAKIYLKEMLNGLSISADSTIIATAGTPTTLAAMDLCIDDVSSPKIHGHELSIQKIAYMSERLLSSTLNTILDIPGVHPQRADILPAGTLILLLILEQFQANSCIVSKKGLRYGIVQSMMH